MSATHKILGRPRTARRFQDGWRALVVCALLVVFGVTAIAIGIRSLNPTQTHTLSAEELRTGSLLFVPSYGGSNCRQAEFDNQTGRFTDKGPIPCEEALERSIGVMPHGSTTRIEAVRKGFRGN